ncbi:MAG: ROK family protein, partial [Enterobacteriaceae bacterium]
LACELLEQVGYQLGKAIAISVNLFNPQKVVIAGEITLAQNLLLSAIGQCINTQTLKAFRQPLPVVISELHQQNAIGSFALVKQAMLNGLLLQHLLK